MLSDEGDGARVLAAVLSTLPELGVRRRDWGKMGGGEGGSIGAIDTRPAMRETRCWDDRRRGRGEAGTGEPAALRKRALDGEAALEWG